MIITKENIFSLIQINSERAEEKLWRVSVTFDNRKKTFLYESVENPTNEPAGFIQQLLSVHEDFGVVPSYKAYKAGYFGEAVSDEEVKEYYTKDITNAYKPTLELFKEHTDQIYDVCVEINLPIVINELFK